MVASISMSYMPSAMVVGYDIFAAGTNMLRRTANFELFMESH